MDTHKSMIPKGLQMSGDHIHGGGGNWRDCGQDIIKLINCVISIKYKHKIRGRDSLQNIIYCVVQPFLGAFVKLYLY